MALASNEHLRRIASTLTGRGLNGGHSDNFLYRVIAESVTGETLNGVSSSNFYLERIASGLVGRQLYNLSSNRYLEVIASNAIGREIGGPLSSNQLLEIISENGVNLEPVIRIGEVTYPTIADAVAAAEDGDTIILSAGTFALGDSRIVLPAGVNLAGAGKAQTIITSTISAAVNIWQTIVEPGTNSAISGLTIQGIDGGTYQIPFGSRSTAGYSAGSAPTGVTLTNVKMLGITDAMSVATTDTNVFSYTFTGCDFISNFDTVVTSRDDNAVASTLVFNNCTFVSDGPSPIDPGANNGPLIGFGVEATFSGGSITVSGGTGVSSVAGLNVFDLGTAHLTNGIVITTSDSEAELWDIVNVDSTVTTDGTAVYDPEKVSGIVTGP